jgi:S1-C subfamily serine protease
MKLCNQCGQLVAEEITVCPTCGNDVVEGRKYIDDYRILDVLHEGYSSVLCKAIQNGSDQAVMIRIFTPQSGVDDSIAQRLQQELEKLKELPEDYFIRHLEIKKSSDGLWYRVSEWIEAENWGTLLASGGLNNFELIFGLFLRIAAILEGLHQIGHIIPHLILDDIIVFRTESGELEIKIDFKLSRFLDPALDKPGAMLQQLLTRHPDIIKQRPLDFRSDIWSLGKVFIEILTADYDASNYKQKIDELPLPNEIKALFRIMLADDPDLRPKSMRDVTQVLAGFKDPKRKSKWKLDDIKIRTSAREIKGIKNWISLLIIIAIILFLGALTWLYYALQKGDSESVFERFVNQYAASVAFVVTEYWLNDDEDVIYHGLTEGTAFLVDKKGYLMTNRHVACPWLEDATVNALITRFKHLNRPIHLKYRIFLWFEGERAFKRLPVLSDRSDPADIYFLESAYRTDGVPQLTIAGVARLPVKTWQVVKYPLRDDFAILKIEKTPKKLLPLPLDLNMKTSKIRRLSPVITIGFPLGSETQQATVNVSVTSGHVRRTFDNLFQVDTSIYRGNSGGPIIDRKGNVIGIASRVAVEMASAPLPVATRLSDIGMVLPINKAAVFMQEIYSGEEKWNGVLDLTVDRKIQKIKRLARDKKWKEAESLVQKELSISRDPALILAAGMITFCLQKQPEAISFFKRALSMDKQDHISRFMIFLIDWLAERSARSPYRDVLLTLDWRAPLEFYGYLVKILEGSVAAQPLSENLYSQTEKSWFHYTKGIEAEKRENWIKSEASFKTAMLTAESDSWVYFLALAGLDRIQQTRMNVLQSQAIKTKYLDDGKSFIEILAEKDVASKNRVEQIAPLLSNLMRQSTGIKEKREILERWYVLDPTDREVLVWLAYYCAMDEKWEKALAYTDEYLQINGRENAGRLSLGLLKSGILHFLGSKEKAAESLEMLATSTRDPWYQKIVRCIQGKLTEQFIVEKSGDSPEYLLSAHTALGFWAEGSGDKEKAFKHYEESLGSYLDDKVEYEFAMMRIKNLKLNSNSNFSGGQHQTTVILYASK